MAPHPRAGQPASTPPGGTPPPRPVATRPPVRGLRRYLAVRNWRVRSKLVAVLVLPTVAFTALAGFNLGGLLLDARAYEFDARTAQLGSEVTDLVHELQLERDLSVGVLIQRDEGSSTRLAAQQREVDDAVDAYREAGARLRGEADPTLTRTMGFIDRDLSALPQLRDAVRGGDLTTHAALDEYAAYITDLLQVTSGLTGSKRDPELGQAVQALEAFSEEKERASQVRGLLYAIALRGDFESGEREALTGALAREQAATERFVTVATGQQSSLVSEAVRGQASLTVFQLQSAARQAATGGAIEVDPEQWLAASSTRIEQMRTAEAGLLHQVVERSQALGASTVGKAIVTATSIAGVLFFTLVLSVAIARSMLRQLSSLQAGALEVAQVQLPETVDRLRKSDPGPQRPTEIVPVAVHSADELGQLAAAFDAVHRQALWLATEQAVLRRNVNSMFVNFSRRSQSLVESQLQRIDELEANEQDPAALENLFRLDHLATRMRRNNESLLVIAGSETTRRWSAPVPLPDVVLAAVSEIEHFTRVTQRTEPDVALAGHAVSDVVHLLAELLENATRSSSPQSSIVVSGTWTRGGSEALVEVEDRGVGMTRKDLAEANRRLSGQPGDDVPSSAHMGLFVVSRLARRHGISVTLSESAHGGVLASVWLPTSLVSPVVDASATAPAPSEREAESPAAAPSRDRGPVPSASPVARGGGQDRPTTSRGLPMRTSRPRSGPPQPGDRTRAEPTRPAPARAENAATAPSPHTPPAPARQSSPPPSRQDPPPPSRQSSPPPARQDPPPPSRQDPPPPARQSSPPPARQSSPPPARPQEDPNVVLSVFDSVSEWFRQQAPGPAAAAAAAGSSGARTAATGAASPGDARSDGGDGGDSSTGTHDAAWSTGFDAWASTGDHGWAAAEEAREPVADGLTGAGLPIRRPMAHFVPGSPDQARPGPAADGRDDARPATHQDEAVDGTTPPTGQPAALPSTAGGGFARTSQPSPDRVRGLLSSYYRGVREARGVDVTRDDRPAARDDSQDDGARQGPASAATDTAHSSGTGHSPDRQERT